MSEAGGDGTQMGGQRVMRLRYAGTCHLCQAKLPAGTFAWYDPASKKVRCVTCPAGETPPPTGPSAGTAGGSAERTYRRRSERHRRRVETEIAEDAAWREQVKKDHPILGRVASAVTAKPTVGPEPRHVAAWKAGADGERKVGVHLDNWAQAMGGRVLHDRRIPGTSANIDHIALNSDAIWVIDAKEYRGLVTASRAGLFRDPDLLVAGRRKTHLADAVLVQMDRVAAALDAAAGGQPRPPVYGVLCFVGADWPLIGGTFTVRGVTVAWPVATVKMLTRSGGCDAVPWLDRYTAVLAKAFPPA